MEQQVDRQVSVNDRRYQFPRVPTVVVCVDGSEPGYIEAAIARGLAPNLDRIMREGTSTTVRAVIPSFTNPNNISIITGRPPSVHGIAGNYFFDRASGQEVMMNDPKFFHPGTTTVMQGFEDAGATVAVVTAKEKLRKLLAYGLDFGSGRSIAFSSEQADRATLAESGIDGVLDLVGMPLPDVYSIGLSEFVFAAGVRLMEERRPDLMYLSTTDFVQHCAAPGSELANAFYAMLDRHVGRLDAIGCVVVLTADHGMNDKFGSDGQPEVIYLQDQCDAWLGPKSCRVILPITDPYVAHHGALGSFAMIYLPDTADPKSLIEKIRPLRGVDVVLGREEACARFDLPVDRTGDLVVISDRGHVLGTTLARHDLSGLSGPLRSHGGLAEQMVPLISNRKLNLEGRAELRNFDAFDLALNAVVHEDTGQRS